MTIHHTAIVSEDAILGNNVDIGPYCTIGAGVTLGDEVRLISHVCIDKNTTVGKGTVFYPFASIGQSPQHLTGHMDQSKVIIGEFNQIREYVTIHRGTVLGGGITTIGSNCLIMIGSHIAHDCWLGDHIIMSNQAHLGGHVIVENHAVIGGVVGIHQFSRIGEGAMIGGLSGVAQDVAPYSIVTGIPGILKGFNVKKLKRLGVAQEEIHAVWKTFEWLFYTDIETFFYRLNHIPSEFSTFQTIKNIVDFITNRATRPICQAKSEDSTNNKNTFQQKKSMFACQFK